MRCVIVLCVIAMLTGCTPELRTIATTEDEDGVHRWVLTCWTRQPTIGSTCTVELLSPGYSRVK